MARRAPRSRGSRTTRARRERAGIAVERAGAPSRGVSGMARASLGRAMTTSSSPSPIEAAPTTASRASQASQAARAPRVSRVSRVSPADEEALRLVMKLAERVEVARSFTKICAGLVHAQFASAAEALRSSEVARVARAAAEVAVKMTADELRRAAGPAARPRPNEAPGAPGSLDHEALHDDAC
jgi:hypothetical protein